MSTSIIYELKEKYKTKYIDPITNELVAMQKTLLMQLEKLTITELASQCEGKVNIDVRLTDYHGYPKADLDREITVSCKIPYENISNDFKKKFDGLLEERKTILEQLDEWEISAMAAKASKQNIPLFEVK